jgi:hypothetical protein
VPQIPNVLTSSQPQPNINVKHFVINITTKMRSSLPAIYRGLFLIFIKKLTGIYLMWGQLAFLVFSKEIFF